MKQWIVSVKMILQTEVGAGKMAQWVKVLDAKPEDLSLFPGPRVLERER